MLALRVMSLFGTDISLYVNLHRAKVFGTDIFLYVNLYRAKVFGTDIFLYVNLYRAKVFGTDICLGQTSVWKKNINQNKEIELDHVDSGLKINRYAFTLYKFT